MAQKRKLVVVGNGMAAGRTIETLLAKAPDRFDITLFGAEPRVNYNRILLSPVLSGEKRYEDILIHDRDWYARHGIDLRQGQQVVELDRMRKAVRTAAGEWTAYDTLLLATGSQPVMLPLPGADLQGVLTYRDLDDVEAMIAATQRPCRAVVIGGGLLGLEAAAGLQARGAEVSVVHLTATLMERQLDASAGYLLQRALEARGIEILTNASSEEILGRNGAVSGIRLRDGRVLAADLVVMAVGIRPEVTLAAEAGLFVDRGVIVDDGMHTSDREIFAVGECVEHDGECYGLVAPLYDMAAIAAAQIAGESESRYGGSVTATKLKVTGIDLYSAGRFDDAADSEDIVLRDAARGLYKRVVLQDDRIVGTVLYGDTADGPWLFDLMKQGASIADLRETLIFGQAYAGGAPLDPMAAVAALPDEAEICGCNGVCKSTIVNAIDGEGLRSLEAVRTATKASASCGSCTSLVEQLLALSLGEEVERQAVPPMCPCTDRGHDEVRRLILAHELTSIPAVMQQLEWKSSCGCARCRPALNYYLLAAWPGRYEDDQQSRFINERVHANIQKDGTYSVVPRMWGGMTSAAELRAIADVADKFAIPSVKVTGGQRIDLLGVQKDDLPAVWADLNQAGLVSGHAYGKALRTVKTCVGTDWCRFGTQDSTGLGIRMEKFFWGSWTPHKVKMAVSGCPRNCAEATCKDIGVVCVDSGYELHFAGAAGMEVRATDRLCTLKTEAAVIEHAAALLQLYREQARYLERIHKWAARIGHDTVREQIVEDGARRRALYERFLESQRVAQTDPWQERAEGRDRHEFSPLADLSREAVA